MFGDASFHEGDMNYYEDDMMEISEEKGGIIGVSIPKVEPCSFNADESNENLLHDDEIIRSPIPFTTPYKIKDPIVLLERCDKIWDTLKLIKNVQTTKSTNNLNETSSEANNKSSYIKYQPVLGNDNAALPNFKLSVKSKKKVYTCSMCGRQYTRNRSLRSHLERIHNFVLPKQLRKSTVRVDEKSIDKEKNSDVIEKEEDNLRKVENKSPIDISLQSASLPVMKSNESSKDSQSQKAKGNILMHSSNNLNAVETTANEQEHETLDNEFDENEDYSEYVRCVLCKQYVKDIGIHLIEYHKIESTDFMLKELEKTLSIETSTLSNVKESRKTSFNGESLETEKIHQKEHSSVTQKNIADLNVQRQEKRKSNMLGVNSRKRRKSNCNYTCEKQIVPEPNIVTCNICLRTYASSSIYKHLRTHRARGETKENFHMSHSNYHRTPFRLAQKTTKHLSNMTPENTCKNKDNIQNSSNLFQNNDAEEQTFENANDNENKSDTENDGKYKATCTCGRSYRNPYTYFIHKQNCNLQNCDVLQSTAKNNVRERDQHTSPSSCDRDSGIGISITIKKKNNSYEVVGKDTGDENISVDSDASTDIYEDYTSTELQDQSHEFLQSSKYSDSHSILKIQSINEDTEVDIEDDSERNCCNNNNRRRFMEQEKQNISTKHKMCQAFNLHWETNVHKQKRKRSNKFNIEEDVGVHFITQHLNPQLICGYCNESFPGINMWVAHQCSINEGKSFTHLLMELHCHYCNVVVNTFKKFDEHTKLKHFDSVVPYQCFQCEKRFPNTTSRKTHFDADHALSICSLCEMKCYNTAKARHEAYHYGLGFPCHLCKKSYTSKISSQRHKLKVHPKCAYGLYNTTCVVCDVNFPSKRAFNLHRRNGGCRLPSEPLAERNIELERL